MNEEAPEKDKTKLVALSDDVVNRKRDTLRNFLMHSFPECLSEGRIDFETLRRALGDWVEAGNGASAIKCWWAGNNPSAC